MGSQDFLHIHEDQKTEMCERARTRRMHLRGTNSKARSRRPSTNSQTSTGIHREADRRGRDLSRLRRVPR